jgi:hypothetical protein
MRVGHRAGTGESPRLGRWILKMLDAFLGGGWVLSLVVSVKNSHASKPFRVMSNRQKVTMASYL